LLPSELHNWRRLSFPYHDIYGRIEATFDFCAQANPQAAPQYQERKKAMVEDAPEQEVAEARSTDEYKDAYESTSAQLGEAPKDQAVEACKAAVEEK
jgi:hypothetical protein